MIRILALAIVFTTFLPQQKGFSNANQISPLFTRGQVKSFENLFQRYGIIDISDKLKLENVSLHGNTSNDYIQFLAEKIRQFQWVNYQLEKESLKCFKENINSDFCEKRKRLIYSSIKESYPKFKLYLARKHFIDPIEFMNKFPYVHRRVHQPKKLKVGSLLFNNKRTLHFSQKESIDIIGGFASFIQMKYNSSGENGDQINIDRDVFKFKSFIKNQRLQAQKFASMRAWIEEYLSNQDLAISKLISENSLLPFYSDNRSLSIDENIIAAIERKLKELKKQFNRKLDFTYIQALSPNFISSQSNYNTDFSHFTQTLQSSINASKNKVFMKRAIVGGSVCLVAVVFGAWPICIVYTSLDTIDSLATEYNELKISKSLALYEVNKVYFTEDYSSFQNKREKFVQSGALGALSLIAVGKSAQKLQKTVPVKSGWRTKIRTLLVSKKDTNSIQSWVSPGCLVGNCKAITTLTNKLLQTQSGETARNWVNFVTIFTIASDTLFNPTLEISLDKIKKELQANPKYNDSLVPFEDHLNHNPKDLNLVLTTLYRLDKLTRYDHIKKLHSKESLSLFEIKELMARTDIVLRQTALFPPNRPFIVSFLEGSISWSELNDLVLNLDIAISGLIPKLKNIWNQQTDSPLEFNQRTLETVISFKDSIAKQIETNTSLYSLLKISRSTPLSTQVIANYLSINAFSYFLVESLIKHSEGLTEEAAEQKSKEHFGAFIQFLNSNSKTLFSHLPTGSLSESLNRLNRGLFATRTNKVVASKTEYLGEIKIKKGLSIQRGLQFLNELLYHSHFLILAEKNLTPFTLYFLNGQPLQLETEQLMAMSYAGVMQSDSGSEILKLHQNLNLGKEFDKKQRFKNILDSMFNSELLSHTFQKLNGFFNM